MAPEEWQPVPGYIDYYSVSSLGRVRLEVDRQGFGSGYILTQYTRKTGYIWVNLYRPRQQYPYAVHELVLSAFDGPRPLGFTADHINGVKSDNRYENLEWVPHVENVRRNRELRHTRLNERFSRREYDYIVAMRQEGQTLRMISHALGIPVTTLWFLLEKGLPHGT